MTNVIHLALDTHCQLQKLDGFAGMTKTQLTEVAHKVYHKKEKKKWNLQEEPTKVLMAVYKRKLAQSGNGGRKEKEKWS